MTRKDGHYADIHIPFFIFLFFRMMETSANPNMVVARTRDSRDSSILPPTPQCRDLNDLTASWTILPILRTDDLATIEPDAKQSWS